MPAEPEWGRPTEAGEYIAVILGIFESFFSEMKRKEIGNVFVFSIGNISAGQLKGIYREAQPILGLRKTKEIFRDLQRRTR